MLYTCVYYVYNIYAHGYSIYMCIYTLDMCVYICVPVYMCALIQIHAWMESVVPCCVYVCMHVCMFVHVCVCVYIADTVRLKGRIFPLKMSPEAAGKP